MSKINFEETYKKLETIVRELENNEISLEEAVNKYKEGLELSKQCFNILKEHEEVIVKKMTEDGIKDI